MINNETEIVSLQNNTVLPHENSMRIDGDTNPQKEPGMATPGVLALLGIGLLDWTAIRFNGMNLWTMLLPVRLRHPGG